MSLTHETSYDTVAIARGAYDAVTYCRLCEAMCGLVATVDNGRVTSLAPDPDHPLSRGRACPKGLAFVEITNDPDRVLHPLRRNADGEFEQVSWDEALDDIAARLDAIRKKWGAEAIGHYLGNPVAFAYANGLWSGAFLLAIGGATQYTVGSQDINCRFVASKLLYDAASLLPFPDLARTDFLLIVGANPLVSNGSALRAPRVRDDLNAITGRGGRVVVVDPRRSETARLHEHVSIKPNTDAWMLLAMLQVIFAEGLEDEAVVRTQANGLDQLRSAVAGFTPEVAAAVCEVPAETITTLARDFAAAPSATAYGRTGACLGSHGTLVSWLIDVLAIVTGNLDRPGGTLLPQGVVPLEAAAEASGRMTYAAKRSRIGGLPDVMGVWPSTLMASDIMTPGPGQVRAMIINSGNPVLSVPDGEGLEAALGELDLLVSLDLYLNESNRTADYILPAATWLEREDYPFLSSASSAKVTMQWTGAVVPPAGEAREEWSVFADLADRMKVGLFGPRWMPALRPNTMLKVLLRLGPYGDRFGLRPSGLNQKKLEAHPHGMVLAEHSPTGILAKVVRYKDKRVRLAPPEILTEIAALAPAPQGEFPLLLIGLRENRSLNSWLHNSPALMKGDRKHRARINPCDLAPLGLADGDRVRIVSAHGAIETLVKSTDEVRPGTLAVPHGWGHRGGWRIANAGGGVNVNQLMNSAPDSLERLAGMALLNGVPVRLERASYESDAVGRGA